MAIEHVTDHGDQAADKLTEQFRGTTYVSGLVRSWAEEVQELEDAAVALLTADDIDSALGLQLDTIGALVKQVRGKRTDLEYRPWLKARILANRSNGRAQDIIAILKLLLPTGTAIQWLEQPPAAFEVFITDPIDGELGNQIAQLLLGTEAGGVRVLTSWTFNVDTFKFSDVFDADSAVTAKGFDNGYFRAVSDGSRDAPMYIVSNPTTAGQWDFSDENQSGHLLTF